MAKDRKANQKRLLIRCALWFLAVLIVFSIAYFIPKVSGALKATYVARYDNVFVSDKVEVYLVRSETVNYAERSGTIFPDMITVTEKIEKYIQDNYDGRIDGAIGSSLGSTFV